MRIHGNVVDVNGSPAPRVRIELRGFIKAQIRIEADPELGSPRPRIVEVRTRTDLVHIETDDAGEFDVHVHTPEIERGEDAIGDPTFGATARALGPSGETLATADVDDQRTDAIALALRLAAPEPAFESVSLRKVEEFGPHETRRLFVVGQVNSGPLRVDATSLKQEALPPDELNPRPRLLWVPDEPARFRMFPLQGDGSRLNAVGSGEVIVGNADGGPRHAWVCDVTNPSDRRARIRCGLRYTSRRPIQLHLLPFQEVNSRISKLLQLGPHDIDEPPIRLIVGQQVRVVVREDWRRFFGPFSAFDVPVATVRETTTARPTIQLIDDDGVPTILMRLVFDTERTSADIGEGLVLDVEATNLTATLKFRLRHERHMIVPYCEGETDFAIDIDSPLGEFLLPLLLSAFVPAILPGLGSFAGHVVSKELTERVRNVVRHDIPAAINAKRYEFGRIFSDFLAGRDRKIVDFGIDAGRLLVRFIGDEREPVPPLEPEPVNEILARKVDHIVLLMLENRSFDHMLGYLQRDAGRDEIDGLTPPDARGNTGQWNAHGHEIVQPHPIPPSVTTLPAVDPCHEVDCTAAQVGADGRMLGFVESFARRLAERPGSRALPSDVMAYYGSEQVWAFHELASHFAVCDRWFASHPGPTWPNRFFTIAGRLGLGEAGGPDVDMTGGPTPIRLHTIFDELTLRGVSWRYYEHDIAFLRKVEQFTLDFEHVAPVEDFYARARSGNLPSVTFIDPNFLDIPDGPGTENDDHPPADIADGQELVARIYEALRNGANWERTLFIVTYDEHGGFYDHCPPPRAAAPDGSLGTLGVRVPALVASPWIPARHVEHAQLDHTVVAKTIFRRFSPQAIPDLGPRFREARDLSMMLTLEEPRLDDLPRIPRPSTVRSTERRAPAPLHPDDDLRRSLMELRAFVDTRRPS